MGGNDVRLIFLAFCLTVAGIGALMKREGWGWFLFVGFFLIPPWTA